MLGRSAGEINQINDLRVETTQIPAIIAGIENQIAVEEQTIRERILKIDAFTREQIQPLQGTLDSLKARIAQLTLPEECQRLQEQIAACDAASSLLRSQIDILEQQLAPIDAEIGALNRAIEVKTAERGLISLRGKLQQVRDRYNSLQDEYRRYETQFNDLNERYRNAELALSSLRFQQDTDYAFNHNSWLHHHHHYDGYDDGGGFIHAIGDTVLAANIYDKQQAVNGMRVQLNDYQYRMQSAVNAMRGAQDDETSIQYQVQLTEALVAQDRTNLRGSDFNESIVSLQTLKRIQNEKREPLENLRISLQKQLDSSVGEKASYNALLTSANQELSRADRLAMPYSSIQEVAELKRQETECQVQLAGLLATRGAMSGDVAAFQVSIQQRRKAIDDYRLRATAIERSLLYPNAYDRFKSLLQAMPHNVTSDMRKLYQYGWDLLRHIDEDEAHAIKKNKPQDFNKASHADVLNAAAGVLEGHASLDSLKVFDDVMRRSEEHIHGRPSVTRKVFGGMLVFLGGALLIAGSSILGCVLPLVSWPLSYVGVAVGAGLLAGGIALIVSGRRKGADQSLHQYRDLAPSAFKGSMFNPVATPAISRQEVMNAPSAPPLHIIQ